MDLDEIYEYLDSPYLMHLRSADDEVVGKWQQIIEQTLFAVYNNGEPLSNEQRIQVLERGAEQFHDYDFAIFTEEREGLCRTFADMARLVAIELTDGTTIEDWSERQIC